jgi:hypothetical protein
MLTERIQLLQKSSVVWQKNQFDKSNPGIANLKMFLNFSKRPPTNQNFTAKSDRYRPILSIVCLPFSYCQFTCPRLFIPTEDQQQNILVVTLSMEVYYY